MSEKYVSFRISKGGGTTAIRNKIVHDNREGYIPKNVDHERIKNNVYLLGDIRAKDISGKVEQLKDRVKALTGRKAQESAELLHTGVMSFSAEMRKDYEVNPQQFQDNALKFFELIKAKYGLQVINAVIHLDEDTPHIELLFDNISESTGKGVRRTINPSKLSQIQSDMGECFSNMGYKRGKPKTETMAKHTNSSAYYMLKEELQRLTEDVQTINNVMEAYKADNKEVMLFVDYFKKNKNIDKMKSKNIEKGQDLLNSFRPQ